jgi:hypothetical protein
MRLKRRQFPYFAAGAAALSAAPYIARGQAYPHGHWPPAMHRTKFVKRELSPHLRTGSAIDETFNYSRGQSRGRIT